MIESWRWYGDLDTITLDEVAQTGARGIVTALHEVPYGAVWSIDAITERNNRIKAAGFDWVVVESLPIHEDIKRGTGDLPALFAAYRQSMVNLAAVGINLICYNFMPLLDWTRTDLAHRLPSGATCMRFDLTDFAVFDQGHEFAGGDYPASRIKNPNEPFVKGNAMRWVGLHD